MSYPHALSEDEWVEVLKSLFVIKGRRVQIPQDPQFTVAEAASQQVHIDSVPLDLAIRVLSTMSDALRTIPPTAVETLLWLAGQSEPGRLDRSDLVERTFTVEEEFDPTAVEDSWAEEIDDLLADHVAIAAIAEELGIPVEWVQRRELWHRSSG